MDKEAVLQLAFERAAQASRYWEEWKRGFGSSRLEAAIGAAREADALMAMAKNEGPKGRRKAFA